MLLVFSPYTLLLPNSLVWLVMALKNPNVVIVEPRQFPIEPRRGYDAATANE